jgi:hypothetical protein
MLLSPHEFVLERTCGTGLTKTPAQTYLPRALLTLAITLLVALALPAAYQPLSWRSVALNAAFKLGAVVVVAGVVWISWRIVGGCASGSKFIVAYAYLSAAWLLIFSFLTAIDEGAIRLFEPGLFAQVNVSTGQDTKKLRVLIGSEATYAMKALLDSEEEMAKNIRAPGVPWILSMAALRGVFTFCWLIVSWGVFRKMMGLSQFRSVFSLAIFLGLGLTASLVLIFFQMAPVVVDPGRWIPKWPFSS